LNQLRCGMLFFLFLIQVFSYGYGYESMGTHWNVDRYYAKKRHRSKKGKSTYELVTFCLVSDAKIVPWNNFRERLWTMCLRNKSSQFYFEFAEGFSGTLPYYWKHLRATFQEAEGNIRHRRLCTPWMMLPHCSPSDLCTLSFKPLRHKPSAAEWRCGSCEPATQDDPRWPKMTKKEDPRWLNSVNVTESSSSRLQASGRRKLWKKTSTFWVENGRTRFNIFRNRFNVVQPSSGSWSMKCRCLQSPWLGCETWSYMVKSSKRHCERNMKCLHCKRHWTKQNQNMSATCIILYELVKFETCPLQPSNCKVKNSCWARKLGSCAPPERLGSWVSGLNELQF